MTKTSIFIWLIIMIIIWKYERTSRIHKDAVKTYRSSHLFSPCIGIGRDHCRVPFTWKYIKWLWYIIIWSKSDYIDKNGFYKSSITPRCILGIPSLGKKKVFWKNSTQWYDLWRGCIFKPIRRLYNIYIKNPVYRYFIKR